MNISIETREVLFWEQCGPRDHFQSSNSCIIPLDASFVLSRLRAWDWLSLGHHHHLGVVSLKYQGLYWAGLCLGYLSYQKPRAGFWVTALIRDAWLQTHSSYHFKSCKMVSRLHKMVYMFLISIMVPFTISTLFSMHVCSRHIVFYVFTTA